MVLSAPTLTAPPGFALRWLRRASHKGACPPPLILGAGGGVPPARNRRKRTSFRCTFRCGGRETGACIPAAAPRKRTGFLFAPAHKTPARFPDGASGARKRRTPLPACGPGQGPTAPIKVLIWYADYFDVSMDYLCCRTEKPQGRLYEFKPRILEEDKDMKQFVEMCFDPKSPMNDRLKKAIIEMLEGVKE